MTRIIASLRLSVAVRFRFPDVGLRLDGRMTWGQFGVSMTKKQGTKFVSCFFVAFGSKVQAVWIEQKIIYIDDKNTIFIIVHRNKTASYDNFFEIVINFC